MKLLDGASIDTDLTHNGHVAEITRLKRGKGILIYLEKRALKCATVLEYERANTLDQETNFGYKPQPSRYMKFVTKRS